MGGRGQRVGKEQRNKLLGGRRAKPSWPPDAPFHKEKKSFSSQTVCDWPNRIKVELKERKKKKAKPSNTRIYSRDDYSKKEC